MFGGILRLSFERRLISKVTPKTTHIAVAPHFKESKVLFFLRSKLRQYFIDVDVSTGALIADNDIDKEPVRSDRPGR